MPSARQGYGRYLTEVATISCVWHPIERVRHQALSFSVSAPNLPGSEGLCRPHPVAVPPVQLGAILFR